MNVVTETPYVFKPVRELKEEAITLPPGELFERAMADLHDDLKSKETNPSDLEWKGLEQITLAIEGMADGTIPEKFYLSALAPGVGKTSAVCSAIRTMVGMKEKYKNTSAIVFVFRCEEIKRLKDDMKLDDNDFAVLVSEKGEYAHMNKWGNADRTKARVLFTTQQRLEWYC